MKLTEKDLALTVKEFAEKYAGKTFRSNNRTYVISSYKTDTAEKTVKASLGGAGVVMSLETSESLSGKGAGFTAVVPEVSPVFLKGGTYLVPDMEYTEETEPVTPSTPDKAEG